MTNDTQQYNIAAIRELLLAAFEPRDLTHFCLDHPVFNPVLDRFGPDMGLDDMVDRVIGYCRVQALWDELLVKVKQANPGQYERFEPRLRLPHEAPAQDPPERQPSTILTDDRENTIRVEGKVLYCGPALLAIRTESRVIVENISGSPVAIRLSWDGQDLFGTGAGEDSFINNWVPAGERVSREFKEHSSAQMWAWQTTGSLSLVDMCSLLLDVGL